MQTNGQITAIVATQKATRAKSVFDDSSLRFSSMNHRSIKGFADTKRARNSIARAIGTIHAANAWAEGAAPPRCMKSRRARPRLSNI
jgi:hypothetical protein